MNYCFGQQPQAAAVNLSGLAGVFVELVERVAQKEGVGGADLHALLEGVRASVSHGYVDTFYEKNNENAGASSASARGMTRRRICGTTSSG